MQAVTRIRPKGPRFGQRARQVLGNAKEIIMLFNHPAGRFGT
jgi:hypothetical protein